MTSRKKYQFRQPSEDYAEDPYDTYIDSLPLRQQARQLEIASVGGSHMSARKFFGICLIGLGKVLYTIGYLVHDLGIWLRYGKHGPYKLRRRS